MVQVLKSERFDDVNSDVWEWVRASLPIPPPCGTSRYEMAERRAGLRVGWEATINALPGHADDLVRTLVGDAFELSDASNLRLQRFHELRQYVEDVALRMFGTARFEQMTPALRTVWERMAARGTTLISAQDVDTRVWGAVVDCVFEELLGPVACHSYEVAAATLVEDPVTAEQRVSFMAERDNIDAARQIIQNLKDTFAPYEELLTPPPPQPPAAPPPFGAPPPAPGGGLFGAALPPFAPSTFTPAAGSPFGAPPPGVFGAAAGAFSPGFFGAAPPPAAAAGSSFGAGGSAGTPTYRFRRGTRRPSARG